MSGAFSGNAHERASALANVQWTRRGGQTRGDQATRRRHGVACHTLLAVSPFHTMSLPSCEALTICRFRSEWSVGAQCIAYIFAKWPLSTRRTLRFTPFSGATCGGGGSEEHLQAGVLWGAACGAQQRERGRHNIFQSNPSCLQ